MVMDEITVQQPAVTESNGTAKTKQTDANTAFLRAARAGDLEKLCEYLDSGQVTDINTANANGLNALHLACKDGHIKLVRELLNRNASVDNATKKGNTALHIASLAGQKEVIQLLLQKQASVNVQSQNGFTPLYMAAQENHDDCVKYLLEKGANPSLCTENGFSPLAVAIQQGNDKVVAVLLESDTRGKVKLPALHIAAKKDDVKAATLLLENEHNPDVSSKSGFTSLHIAAHYGNVNVANLLIEKGADVNFAAKHNITPLHVACKWGKINMVNLLISKGAQIDSVTRDLLSPLHCACRSGHEQVVDILLENRAPILSKSKNGLTPLHMAAQGDHVDAARILLYHKAPVDEVTVDYLTALHVAAHCGHVRVAKLLLDRKADPNARALNGFTSLHIACKKNRIKMVELLLKHGANISSTTESGLTSLHVASFMGCMNIVIFLLQNDADPDVQTVRGETSLHLASRAQQADIIRILLRNGAQVDAKAREEQTPLHVASRIGNVDIVTMLLQHGAKIDSTTKDNYTPLHIAAKEGHLDVATVLLDNNANIEAQTKKLFTPLHLAAKNGNMNVAELLIDRGAAIDAQGKNNLTPLHFASHYNHQNILQLLLSKGASPQKTSKYGNTSLHMAVNNNQVEIANSLLDNKAHANVENNAGFSPLHMSAQKGNIHLTTVLLEHQADPNHQAKNGLTPLHLCAQKNNVECAKVLLDHNANIDMATKSGFTPLHVATHFGQLNMVKYLIEKDANIELKTKGGMSALHQAAQQGHTLIIHLLLKHKANPNAVTSNGQTPLSIANKLGYVTIVETLKVVTETSVVNTVEEKYEVVTPETMYETFISDSEDEGGADEPNLEPMNMYSDDRKETKSIPMNYYKSQMRYTRETTLLSDQQQYNYMTGDESKNLNDDTHHFDVSREENLVQKYVKDNESRPAYMEGYGRGTPNQFDISVTDNVHVVANPINAGDSFNVTNQLDPYLDSFGGRQKVVPMYRESFLVSFLVDARGGAMRGCRHSGVRVIVPPRSAAQPTRITCRYIKTGRIRNPLMEGEAVVSRILELGPIGAKFLGPVILEVPHFASLRNNEREIVILRSDNGETWREHTLVNSEEAIQDVLNDSFKHEGLTAIEELATDRIVRIVTHDFPHYFAIVSRIRQEIYSVGPEGGTFSATVVPQVQAIFPPNSLTKKIRVGLQVQPTDPNITAKLLGQAVAVSPIVTVEPRRRKFHKAITLSMPAPRAHTQGMINQYSGSAPTLRLLCSITGGQNRAIFEDVTGSTPLTFVKDCVSFTTTVSARFWLMDCRNIADATKMATELYSHMAHVPFMVKFVIFAKRVNSNEAKLSVFCMTDDKEDKTLEQQEHFTEVAKSRDIEVAEGREIYLEFAGNLVPILKTGEQLSLLFNAFKENRLAFTVRVKDQEEALGRITFMDEPKSSQSGYHKAPAPLCALNFSLPEKFTEDEYRSEHTEVRQNGFMPNGLYANKVTKPAAHTLTPSADGYFLSKNEEIHKADIKIPDICNLLKDDWERLARELISDSDIELIKAEYPDDVFQQAKIMFRLWLRQAGNNATGNNLEQALYRINRSDIVHKCISNLELVTDEFEKEIAKKHLEQTNSLEQKFNGAVLNSTMKGDEVELGEIKEFGKSQEHIFDSEEPTLNLSEVKAEFDDHLEHAQNQIDSLTDKSNNNHGLDISDEKLPSEGQKVSFAEQNLNDILSENRQESNSELKNDENNINSLNSIPELAKDLAQTRIGDDEVDRLREQIHSEMEHLQDNEFPKITTTTVDEVVNTTNDENGGSLQEEIRTICSSNLEDVIETAHAFTEQLQQQANDIIPLTPQHADIDATVAPNFPSDLVADITSTSASAASQHVEQATAEKLHKAVDNFIANERNNF